MRKGVRILAGVAAVALAAGGVTVWGTWPAAVRPPDWSAEYDLSARPLDAITSGTVVERGPPTGWSHLVIKSLPRVRADNRPLLPAITVDKASWMFTAFVADVVREEQGTHARHKLRAVGMGLGAAVNGRDTILLPEDLNRWDLNRQILVKGYEVQRKAVLVVHGPSMGLVDTPVWFKCGGGNKLVRYRYALLVDPPSGRLDVWLWSLGADGAACGELTEFVRIGPNTIDEAELVVEPKKMGPLGIPSDDAFAVERFPPGRRSPLPPDLRPLAAKTRFTPAEAAELERRLRELQKSDPTP